MIPVQLMKHKHIFINNNRNVFEAILLSKAFFCNSGFHLGYQIGYIGEGEINLSIHS